MTTRQPVKSAVRSLDVLKYFSVEQRALAQKEMVQKLKYPQSSMTFLLKSMVDSGYLTYDRKSRRYFPTPQVLRLGDWLGTTDYKYLFGTTVITELLQELKALTEETVALSMQNDINVHWHRMLESDLPVRYCIPEGNMYPLTYSSHGWLLLSCNSDEDIDKICRLINVREKNVDLRVDPAVAVQAAATIRKQGYCHFRNAYLTGGSSVAILLPAKISGQHVAIGVGGPTDRIAGKVDYLIETLRNTVERYRDRIAASFAQLEPKATIRASARRR